MGKWKGRNLFSQVLMGFIWSPLKIFRNALVCWREGVKGQGDLIVRWSLGQPLLEEGCPRGRLVTLVSWC